MRKLSSGGRRLGRRRIVLGAALVLALAGAGVFAAARNSGGAADASAPDYTTVASVCDLLTVSDLEAALGEAYLAGTDRFTYFSRVNRETGAPPTGVVLGLALDRAPAMTRCYYKVPVGTRAVELGVVPEVLAKAVWDKIVRDEEKEKTSPRPKGLGDAAVWRGNALFVLVEGKVLGVALSLLSPADALGEHGNRVRTARLARLSLSRLQ